MSNDIGVSKSITAVCPVCERQERMENRQLAQAWLTGHINTEHEDKIPDLHGVE